ncbi:MAG TPA: alpha/beta hydrolase [Solirubrobacteraceae bacterium]|nr:alpha/beta hydrolase [Solirubrobacteraceae bacterium]
MPMLQTSTGPIAYDVRGGNASRAGDGLQDAASGGGPVIVLLPSGAHDRHDFDELRALLPPRLRTISLDWPAHGESPAGSAPATAMRFADVAQELVEQLAPGGAIVLGNSVGGFAAARMAIRRPELVKGLVVVDGGGFAPRTPIVHAFCALMARPGFLRRIYPTFSKRYMRARTPADARAREQSIVTTRRDPGLRAIAELWRSFASPEHDLRREAPSIAAPTLLIWGKRDPVIPARIGKRLARTIPGARLVLLDTGHVPHTSDPQGFAAQLTRFVEEVFVEEAFAGNARPDTEQAA